MSHAPALRIARAVCENPTPLTILVVDDDPEMRDYIARGLMRLEGRPVRVLEAGDGEAALAMARTAAIDLIVSDVVMPRLDGLALCRALADDALLKIIPVLLVSGEFDEAELHTTHAAGVLAKPFNARTLRTCVGGLLDQHGGMAN